MTPADVEAIAQRIADRAILNHEARFTVMGGAIALVAVVVSLVATGRF